MRVLLIYTGKLRAEGEQPLGILYLSSALKQAGHQTRVWVPRLNDYLMRSFIFSKGSLLREIEHFNPQLVGFSVDSTVFPYALQIAKMVKGHVKVPIIFGGPHPTVDPENTLAHPLIDMVCVGEGEEALVEVVNRMEKDSDIVDVANIWCKSNGRIFRNPVRPLIQNLDSLPFPDRDALAPEIYSRQGLSVMTARGCPYHCSYCIENYWHQLYRGKGRSFRPRDTSKIIEELKAVVKKYKPRRISFSDETFTLDRKRCIEICQAYEKEVGVPFLCQTRANTVDGETLKALKKAGCIGVNIGIEAGNDYLRNEILERGMSRETIINAFALAKEVELRTASFNMVGAPFETEETIWETIRLNREVRPDALQISVLLPFKGTKVRALLEENDWLQRGEKISDTVFTVLQRLPTISRYRLFSYMTFFHSYVKSDEKHYPMLNMLRRAYELLLRLVPANGLCQRIAMLVMYRILRVFYTS